MSVMPKKLVGTLAAASIMVAVTVPSCLPPWWALELVESVSCGMTLARRMRVYEPEYTSMAYCKGKHRDVGI
eukprot:987587-Pyramimonas_sp.AAC.1